MKASNETRELKQAAKEMTAEVARAKRKLLEFEVLMSRLDVKANSVRRYNTAADLIKKLS